MSEKLSNQNQSNQSGLPNIGKFDGEAIAIRKMEGPADRDPKAVSEQIMGDLGARKILGYISDGINGFETRAVQNADFEAFYANSPSPQDFQAKSDEYLEFARRRSKSDEEYQGYVADMAQFKNTVYGEERVKAWEALLEKRKQEELGTNSLRKWISEKRQKLADTLRPTPPEPPTGPQPNAA